MSYWKNYLILLLFILFWTGLHVYWQSQLKIPLALENKTITLQGEIVSDPEIKKNSVRFLFKTKEYGQVQLDWYRTKQVLHQGQIWEFALRLKNPHNYDNPGGFNYKRFLFLKRISATGYVYDRAPAQLLFSPEVKTSLRHAIAQQIESALEHRPQAALITGLAVGIRDKMTDEQWELLQKTGTSHLLAISGLHIGLVSGLLFFLTKKFWSFIPRAPLYVPAPIVASITAMIAAFIYSALAGFAIPTQRALIMIIVFMTCVCIRYQFKNRQVLLLAAFLVIIWDPFSLLSASFWLSFIAVGLLFMLGLQQAPKWQRFLSIQWSISLGLTPLVILYFQQISWVSPIANFIAIPFASFFIVPFVLLGLLNDYFWLLAESALNYLTLFLNGLTNFSWAWQTYVVNDSRVWAAIIISSLLLLLPRGIPGKSLGVILLITISFVRPAKPEAGEVWLTVLDVGQGLSVVVQTAEHVLLYDAGMRYDEFDLGEAVIMPFLRYQGIAQIDRLILSHDNLDHTGGAEYIVNHMFVKTIISGEKIKGFDNNERCRAGQSWEWDKVKFEFLYPVEENMQNSNDNSCVLKITTDKKSALLTGDIEKNAEAWLVKHKAGDLKTTILLAPHHGSRTSSTLPFVKLTDPEYIVFSTGYLNRFQFPRKDVVERYKGKIYNTATDGAVKFTF
ncbi:MAG: DNA internalization-related competence protein ComEC/Rec2 [Legionellales bacterium]